MDHSIPHPEFFKAPLEIFKYQGMPYQQLGRSGLWVSRVGLGTWKFGCPQTGDQSRVDEPAALALLDQALALGVTFWDTAARYNNASGNSERIIGRWLAANPDQRRNIVLATKLYGGMDGLTPNHCRLTRGNIKESVYASLERLQTETIDLLYFHHYDPYTPLEETYSALEDLVQADLVRYLAISNFSVDQMRMHLMMETQFSARVRVLAVQNQFDLLRKEPAETAGSLALAAAQGVSFVAYSPLAEGFLTNRYVDVTKVGPGDRIYDQGMLPELATPENMEKLQRLAALAAEWDLEVSQLVLAYTLTLPGMGPVIPAASSLRQLESNARVGQIELSAEQQAAVRAVIG